MAAASVSFGLTTRTGGDLKMWVPSRLWNDGHHGTTSPCLCWLDESGRTRFIVFSDGRADRIVEPCLEQAGDRLRSVTYFTGTDYEQLYLRDDLTQDADLTTFIGLEWRESDITENAYHGTELGEHVYTLRRFENGYLLRVASEHHGVFVTLDGLELADFDDLASVLDDVVDE